MNKNLIILTLIILLGTSLFFNFQKNKFNESLNNKLQLNDEKFFEKKKECNSYRSDIERILEKDILSRNSLDEIFYSPSLNSCLYSYTGYAIDMNGKPMDLKIMGINYLIVDYFTNETIVNGNSVISPNIYRFFEDRKKDLKQ